MDEEPRSPTLAEKLARLFSTVRPGGRAKYSAQEAAEAIRARGGSTISTTYIWQLRKGLRDNPTKKHLEALADFFGRTEGCHKTSLYNTSALPLSGAVASSLHQHTSEPYAMMRALIFDFDGLILDTEVADYRAWQEVFQDHGHDLPLLVWSKCIGRSADFYDPIADLENHLGRRLDRERILSRQRLRHQELIEAESILPGIEDYLREARRLGLKLGLASSSSREWVTGHLSRLGLDAGWHCIRCWGDVERAKPAPDLYVAVLESLEVEANEAIAFEDSPNGIHAAKEAGLFCVAVPNPLTAGLDLSQADLQLGSLAEMPLPQLLTMVAEARDRVPHG
jgi:HAD superfamily hydrolase (TIGR01509 family)